MSGTTIVCSIATTVVLAILYSGFALSKIVIGIIDFNDCDLEPLLPIYLIVGGSVTFLFVSSAKINRKENEISKTCQKLIILLILLTALFNIVWLILGTVWTINTRDTIYSPDYCANVTSNSSNASCLSCSEFLVDYSFVAIIIDWVVTGSLVIAGVGLCCYCSKASN